MLKMRGFILLIIPLFLFGCSNQSSDENVSLKILPTEFTSGAPISNQRVQLFTMDGKLIDEGLSDIEGVFISEELHEGMDVSITLDHPIKDIEYTATISNNKSYIRLETYSNLDFLSVPVVFQNPSLPHGCEITSLTAILNYFGEDVTIEEMASEFLIKDEFYSKNGKNYGPDPHKSYAGEPSSPQGTYVFAGPIVDTVKMYSDKKDKTITAENISGTDEKSIESYVKNGIPVLIWVTLDLSPPIKNGGWWIEESNEFHEAFRNLHAVVITSIDDSSVEVMDPLKGRVTHNRETFFSSYHSLGEQAIIVMK